METEVSLVHAGRRIKSRKKNYERKNYEKKIMKNKVMEDKTVNDKIFNFSIKNENCLFFIVSLHLLVGPFFLDIYPGLLF